MSYTAPLGDTVLFELSPLSYTPPLGDAIIFGHSTTATFAGVLPFSSLAEGYFPVTGVVQGAPFYGYVATSHGSGGPTLYRLSFTGTADAAQPGTVGVVSGTDFFTANISARATVAATVAGTVFYSGLIQPTASVMGTVVSAIPYSASSVAFAPIVGAVSYAMTYSATGEIRVTPSASTIGSFGYICMIAARQGNTAVVSGVNPFIGTILVDHGRVSTLTAALRIQGNVVGRQGVSIALTTALPFSCMVSASTNMSYQGNILARLGLAGAITATTVEEAEEICT